MAVIHISRADAAGNFEGLMDRATDGDEIFIELDTRVVARLLPADAPRLRLLSESLRILRDRGSATTLDGEFGRDLEEIINSHREPLNPPAWD
jgi:antitoxin (DNA-binding transcriptional repressor) of toxin-antitoxin stability system